MSREHRSEWDLRAPHDIGWSAPREIHRCELGQIPTLAESLRETT